MHARSLEYSSVIADRAGKRALPVTEQLGLDQGFRQSGQVHGTKTISRFGRELTGLRIIGYESRKTYCSGNDLFFPIRKAPEQESESGLPIHASTVGNSAYPA